MKLKIVILLFITLILNNISKAYENKILFKVNNEIITTLDILNEINYLNSVNKDLKNLEKEKIYQIAKNSLIKEKMKEIFLLKIYEKIELNDEDFRNLILNNYSFLKINSLDELNMHLKEFGLIGKNLKKKISVQTLWNQYIYTKYYKSVNINVEEIKRNILKNKKQREFLMSEILFDLENNEILEQKFSIIEKSIKENGFENSALIYSISESSKNGGKIGWVKENSINSKILEYISKLNINENTKPIVVPGGFLILRLNEIKETEKEINLNQELETIIRIKTNKQLNQFSNIFLTKIKKEIIIDEL
tara:strand:- start:59 stop:979 length:921 start_codon:yes stop_codon:yes gene_type:complete